MKLYHIRQTKYKSALELFDAVLQRTGVPKKGDLVTKEIEKADSLGGYVTGFCLGDLSVFQSNKGLRYVPTKMIDYAWKNRDDKI